MKNRLGLIVLVLLCVGLGIAFVVTKKQAAEQQADSLTRIGDYSNKWVVVTDNLEEQRQVNAKFEKDLETQKKALDQLTNNYTRVSANLGEVTTSLAKTEETLKATKQEVAKRDARISELETQNQALDKQALELGSAITNLTTQIADTQRKLTSSEGDKAFLEKELKRLMAEKSELERQFNDLAVLRAQVAKLKEELNISRRIEWIRQGLFASTEQKGAQKLMQGLNVPQTQAKAKPTYDLNVEVSADGSVKVIPPLNKTTNAPPAK
jgi:chromosome segregation ATPase